MKKNPETEALKRQIWALEAYANAAKVLVFSKSVRDLTEGVCRGITSQYPYVVAWVGLAENNQEKTVKVTGVSGAARAYAEGIEVSWDENKPSGNGPVGRAIRTGQAQVVNDSQHDPKFEPWRERARAFNIVSYVAVPIVEGTQIIGALIVYASIPNAFSKDEIKLFEDLGSEIGFGLKSFGEHARLEEEQKQRELAQAKAMDALELVITAMSTTMEMRDPYTAGHQRKVASIAEAIAREMGLEASYIYGLKMAALVHDIGKLSIPGEILTKPSRLTENEYALVKEHANNGHLILKDIPFEWPIAEVIRQHHERLDGSGYPYGLKGEEILLGARILAVADIIDSMASHRPYRPALGLGEAIAEISARAGTELDQQVVNAVRALFDKQVLQHLVV